jgi:hypothetical protein
MNKPVLEAGVVTLCGVQGCCPTVDFTDASKVTLKDDHGGQVVLTREEWSELKAKFIPAGSTDTQG